YAGGLFAFIVDLSVASSPGSGGTLNYYPPQPNYAPHYPPAPPSGNGNRVVLIIVFSLLGVGVLVAAALFVYVKKVTSDDNPFSLNTQELVQPQIGECTAERETIVDWSAVVADCSNPAATMRIVSSEIVTGRDIEVECSNPDKLVITDGRVDGEYTVAHSCAAPNLVVGNCYSDGIGGYTYVPVCSGTDARLDRVLTGVTDVGVCEPETDDIAVEMRYILVRSMHFIDRHVGSTYCFAPVS
ncbi:hypothetical protein, partial [Nocardia sp. SSK8]|uniref:hypothetical protein n=1 Tax=Nocardia sp. SSK8 TaxID=3120154 RepID=UPI00300B9A08